VITPSRLTAVSAQAGEPPQPQAEAEIGDSDQPAPPLALGIADWGGDHVEHIRRHRATPELVSQVEGELGEGGLLRRSRRRSWLRCGRVGK